MVIGAAQLTDIIESMARPACNLPRLEDSTITPY
jgi:hypothetical protein